MHSTELKVKSGDPAPARGFFDAYEIRDGAVYGKVALNQIAIGYTEKLVELLDQPAGEFKSEFYEVEHLPAASLAEQVQNMVAPPAPPSSSRTPVGGVRLLAVEFLPLRPRTALRDDHMAPLAAAGRD